ncbi:unnamed protein product [Linum trigynum]|uniref:Uncharacterized protein n=1 Tax=Linum trigynum TaxID=586398 RepID=A0AAV2CG71_9ROSI
MCSIPCVTEVVLRSFVAGFPLPRRPFHFRFLPVIFTYLKPSIGSKSNPNGPIWSPSTVATGDFDFGILADLCEGGEGRVTPSPHVTANLR